MARLGKRERMAKRDAMVKRAQVTTALEASPWGVYSSGEIKRGAYKCALGLSNLHAKTHHMSSYGANGGAGRVRETRDERAHRLFANMLLKGVD